MEDVWLYPRPPVLQTVSASIRIIFAGSTIASTMAAFRVLETSHPPVYYLPHEAFVPGVLTPASGGSFCEWKGMAQYWTLTAGGRRAPSAAWSYADPSPNFTAIRDHLAVYAGAMDACFVGDEQVVPQPGGFYGGWITRDLKGPFKGILGSSGW